MLAAMMCNCLHLNNQHITAGGIRAPIIDCILMYRMRFFAQVKFNCEPNMSPVIRL